MRVLGIDPGRTVTGYGIIDLESSLLRHVEDGEIVVKDKNGVENLALIYEQLCAVIVRTRPQAMAVEEVFYGKNVKSLIKQGEARGVAILSGVQQGLPLYEYSPLMVKQAVVGYGRAEKRQVQHMVRILLQLSKEPSPDAADALAVAICHAHMAWAVPGKAS